MPYRYAELNATLRCYSRSCADRLVLAAGLVGDVLIGDVPFYELSRYDETSALGGAKGVRGIPKNRYYGKRKVFGNLELRRPAGRFRVGDSQYQLGLTGFLDGGRVWADLRARPRARRHRAGAQIRRRWRSAAAEGLDLRFARRPGLVARRPAARRAISLPATSSSPPAPAWPRLREPRSVRRHRTGHWSRKASEEIRKPGGRA